MKRRTISTLTGIIAVSAAMLTMPSALAQTAPRVSLSANPAVVGQQNFIVWRGCGDYNQSLVRVVPPTPGAESIWSEPLDLNPDLGAYFTPNEPGEHIVEFERRVGSQWVPVPECGTTFNVLADGTVPIVDPRVAFPAGAAVLGGFLLFRRRTSRTSQTA
jgi:hypothetical protein